MISCIISGGVGCGKSTACAHLRGHLGSSAFYFSADETARRVLELPKTMETLVDFFGERCLEFVENKKLINRKWLRDIIFREEAARLQLERVVHPAVLAALEDSRQDARNLGCELFLAEVPLHYEIGATVKADLTIVVASTRTMQTRRLMERRGLDQQTIENILRSQWSIEAKVEKADLVIWNDGEIAALEAQVLTLARQIRLA